MRRGFLTEYATEQEKMIHRLRSYLREQHNRQFITVADLSRDTNTSPHEIFLLLTAAGVASARDYRVSAILEALH